MKPLLVLALTLALTGCTDDLKKWAYDTAIAAEQWRAGLTATRVTTADGIDWYLLESDGRNERPSVMLIHGFGADSSNWVRFANELEGDYHFIIPDLPGHGETTRSLDLDYGIEAQAARLLNLARELGIERFHVAGSSMGGAISLAMSLQAPQRIRSMTLVNAAGITLLTEEFQATFTGDSNPLIPRVPEDMHNTLAWAMADRPWMPDFFVEQMGALKAANAAIADKVHVDMQPGISMRSRLADVSVPTLVIWGDQDRLLSVDNAAIFAEEIPGSEVLIMERIGHLPMVEAPARSAMEMARFWSAAPTAL